MNFKLIIAFGSRVTGNSSDESDYDFAVLPNTELTLSDRTDIAEYIANKYMINEDKIDLIDLSCASPILKFEIAQKGKLIEGNTFDFTRFKVHAFKQYADTAKFRKIRSSILLKDYVK